MTENSHFWFSDQLWYINVFDGCAIALQFVKKTCWPDPWNVICLHQFNLDYECIFSELWPFESVCCSSSYLSNEIVKTLILKFYVWHSYKNHQNQNHCHKIILKYEILHHICLDFFNWIGHKSNYIVLLLFKIQFEWYTIAKLIL